MYIYIEYIYIYSIHIYIYSIYIYIYTLYIYIVYIYIYTVYIYIYLYIENIYTICMHIYIYMYMYLYIYSIYEMGLIYWDLDFGLFVLHTIFFLSGRPSRLILMFFLKWRSFWWRGRQNIGTMIQTSIVLGAPQLPSQLLCQPHGFILPI